MLHYIADSGFLHAVSTVVVVVAVLSFARLSRYANMLAIIIVNVYLSRKYRNTGISPNPSTILDIHVDGCGYGAL